MAIKQLKQQIKLLNKRVAEESDIQDSLYNLAMERVLNEATTEELILLAGSEKNGPIDPIKSKEMLKVFNKRIKKTMKSMSNLNS